MEKQRYIEDIKIENGDLFYSVNLPIVLLIVGKQWVEDPTYPLPHKILQYKCFCPNKNQHILYPKSFFIIRMEADGWIHQKKQLTQSPQV